MFVAMPEVQILDVAGPFQIFVRAAESSKGRLPYTVRMATTTPSGSIRTNCDLVLGGGVHYRSIRGRIDTLLIAGGTGAEQASSDEGLRRWLTATAPRVRRLGSICTGAFVLAAAGLLDGKRVATHWQWCARLAALYPQLRVDPEPIFTREGNLWTSAGITAGIDLTLAMVEEDHGHRLALAVARQLVMFLRRPGGQQQFSAALAAQAAPSASLRDLVAWIADNLHKPLTVELLAERARLSPRQFARVFARELGVTPSKLIDRLRVEAARRRLEESPRGLAAVAMACGFGSEETMRRAFLRQLGTPPGAYRERFRRPTGRRTQHPMEGHA